MTELTNEREFAEGAAEHYGYSKDDVPALIEWERYRRGAVTVPGMPGLRAVPCFVAGFNLGRRATPYSECALPPLPEPAIAKGKGFDDVWAEHDYYTAEQVEQIRREAVEADRRARGAITEQEGVAGLRPYEFSVCGQSLRWYLKPDVDALLARQSQEPQSERDGWRWVPELPTLEMQQAALTAARVCRLEDGQPRPLPTGYELWSATYIYRAMLAAAPAHPVAQPAPESTEDRT